jgi:hypothetical protein
VLGDVVGEHVVLLPASGAGDGGRAEAALAWFRSPPAPVRPARPSQVLGQWHIALDGKGLAAFVAAFPDLAYEVRPPTLDDLFLALAADAKGAPGA